MKIHSFGKLGELIGRELDIEAPPGGCTVAELRGLLADRYPHAGQELASVSLRACVDDVIVGEQFPIPPGAAVEFFPPLSGG